MSEKGAIKKSTAQAICDAVKVKEGTTEGVPFKDVAERILTLPTASGEGDKNLSVYTLDQFTFDGSACTDFDASKNKYMGTLLNGCIIPYSNGGTVIDTIRGAERNPDTDSLSSSSFTGYDVIVLPENITNIVAGCFNKSTIKKIIIESPIYIGTSGRSTFSDCHDLEELDTTKIKVTSATTNIATMFNKCYLLQSINVNHWDTSNVTDMSYIFNHCKSVTTLDLSNWDLRNVTTMGGTFQTCEKLVDLNFSNFDTHNLTDIGNLFYQCSRLANLNVSNWDTSNVTDMKSAFYGCAALRSLDISNWDASNVTNMRNMFGKAKGIATIIGSLDVVSANDVAYMFNDCIALTNVTLKNIKISLSLDDSPNLSTDSLINTIQELWDLTGGTSQTLTLHDTSKTNIANIYVKLIPVTNEMRVKDKYIDDKKPCVVCESTDEGAMTLIEYAISKNWAIA